MYASIPGTAGTLENAPDHLSLGNMENDTRIPREERNSCSPENTDTISPSRITTRNLSEVNGNGDAIQTESIDVSKNSTHPEKRNYRLSDEEWKGVKYCYETFVLKEGGELTKKGLRRSLQFIGLNSTKKEIKETMKATGLKGKVEYDEFANVMAEKMLESRLLSNTEEMREAFSVFDLDGNGTIERKELRKVLASVGEKLTTTEVDEMFDVADSNGDEKINYEEFVVMFSKK